MSIVLDTVSYTLLASIFGATALLSLRNSKGADIHPLLLNTQSDVSRLRHAGESAIYRSRMYPNGSPLLASFDRNIRTLLDLYEQGGQTKHSLKPFLGKYSQKQYQWVIIYIKKLAYALFIKKRKNNRFFFKGVYIFIILILYILLLYLLI